MDHPLITLMNDVPPHRPATRLLASTREVVLLDGRGSIRGYRVDLDRIANESALLGWIEHLCCKQWVRTRHIRELIEHVRDGILDPKALITHRIPLEDVSDAYRMFSAKLDNCIKPVLIPPSAIH